jgi:hypothetical protein
VLLQTCSWKLVVGCVTDLLRGHGLGVSEGVQVVGVSEGLPVVGVSEGLVRV